MYVQEILANWAELMELNRTEFLSHLVCNFEVSFQAVIDYQDDDTI